MYVNRCYIFLVGADFRWNKKRKMLKTLLGINNNNPVTRATAYLNKINSSFAGVELALHTMETQYIEWGVEYPKLPAWILKPKDPHLYPESYKFNCHYQLISSWVADPISILSILPYMN